MKRAPKAVKPRSRLVRIVMALVLAWAAGLVWFAFTLPGPAGEEKTEAIVVLTGGSGRVARGIEALEKGWSRRMFISGVYQKVRRAELAEQMRKPRALFECCVELGKLAVNTRTNGEEVADWIAANRISSVRLVTNDWHMRRARMELDREIAGRVRIVNDGVRSHVGFVVLISEYNKFLARLAARTVGQ